MEQSDNAIAMQRAQGAVYPTRKLKLLKDEVLKNG